MSRVQESADARACGGRLIASTDRVRFDGRTGQEEATFITSPPGILFDAPSYEEVMSLPDIEYVMLAHSVGAYLPSSISDTTKRVGQVMIRTETLEQFYKRSEEVLTWFADHITVVPAGLKIRELRAMQPALEHDTRLLASYRREDR
jgi:hypothetical protein